MDHARESVEDSGPDEVTGRRPGLPRRLRRLGHAVRDRRPQQAAVERVEYILHAGQLVVGPPRPVRSGVREPPRPRPGPPRAGPWPRPDRLTVSGVHRGEQRALYDERRDTLIPNNGLDLVVIRPADLAADSRGRLHRNRETDLTALRGLLAAARPRIASDEDRVVDAFRLWLRSQGWTPVPPTDEHADIEAVRGGSRLIGEAKGRTQAPGTDVDTAYGQLLRRMTTPSPNTRYAVIVPTPAVRHALRVPAAVRHALRIDVYEVTDGDEVRSVTDEAVAGRPSCRLECERLQNEREQ